MKRMLVGVLIALFAIGTSLASLDFSTVSALVENRQATFVAVRWVPVGLTREGENIANGSDFPWQRRGEEVWGRSGYPMPKAGASRPATSQQEAEPVFYTEFYIDVIASGGDSQLKGHYYAVMDNSGQIWIDQDGRFHDSRESKTAPERCNKNVNRVDVIPSNNTFGPYVLGDYLHLSHNKGYQFTRLGAVNPLFSSELDYSGRVFRLGQAVLGQDQTKIFLMSELLFASCQGNSYNISVESDLWMGVKPAVTSARLYSPNQDVPANAQLVQKSTALGPTGDRFFAPATTFHNISLKYREYIGVEIWKDDGVNFHVSGGFTTAFNLSDDYRPGLQCEEFIGMHSNETDTDSFLPLLPFPPTVRHYSSGNALFGCHGTLYQDLDNNAVVSAGDKRLSSITVQLGDTVIEYPHDSVVTEGDADAGLLLHDLTAEKFVDNNEDSVFDHKDYIYRDLDTNQVVSANDVRLTDVFYQSQHYECGSRVRVGDTWKFENPVTGISMGKCGDFRFMDMEVLPAQSALTVRINPALQVEQTSQIDITFYPPLQKGERAILILRSPDGADVMKEIYQTTSEYTFQYTPYEGTCSFNGKKQPLMIEVYRNLKLHNDKTGPQDGTYGYWQINTTKTASFLEDRYDCRSFYQMNINPEAITGSCSATCLQRISSRFPNLIARMKDADNKNDVNDPNGQYISTTPSQTILANVNVTGAGIQYSFTAKDSQGTKYIVQVNDDNTYLIWKWVDKTNPSPGKGFFGALDFQDEVTGPYSSVNENELYNGRFTDVDCSANFLECNVCSTGSIPPLGKITEGDTFGIFDGSLGTILSDGIWVFVTPYGEGMWGKEGGEIPIPVWPKNSNEDLSIRVLTTKALFDYNGMIQHPPYFINGGTEGIDYCGIINIGWQNTNPPEDPEPPEEPDPGEGGGRNDGITFSELVVVDQALRYSDVSYNNNIKPDYNPVLSTLIRDFRGYPGGQTHTGRTSGMNREGRNGYPAIWENQFTKLGTEFFPLTDYGIFFVLRDSQDGGLLYFDAPDREHKIVSIDITGPFWTPLFPLPDTYFEGLAHVPVQYEQSGEIHIDSSNYEEYELTGRDWTNVINPGKVEAVSYSQSNTYLQYSRKLNYEGIPKVIVVDELIPVSYGKILIEVKLADGRVASYFDCCDEPIEGIPSRALEISNFTGSIEVEEDSEFTLTVKEYEPIQSVRVVNDAVVFIWQDRGVKTQYAGLSGAGDGWITGAPESSTGSGSYGAYSSYDDLDEDGKISFNSYETEIIGSYDLATNTWFGGIRDARTFQVNNGIYRFQLSQEKGCVVDMLGYDFNENRILDDNELLPVYVTAYKYGDDNNDRGFTPLYSSPVDNKQFSHEVYIAGQSTVPVGYSSGPKKSLVISMSPRAVTAGVSSETVFQGDSLQFTVKDEDGSAIDLTNGGRLTAQETAALFFDDVPVTLPAYYWLKTDLHNTSSDQISNEGLYQSKNLLKYDFSEAKKGIYRFKNFVVNDQGSFRLRVQTSDGKKYGTMEVKAEQPIVEYTIKKDDGSISLPTVGNRYQVTAKVYDADKKLLNGTGLKAIPYFVFDPSVANLPDKQAFIAIDTNLDKQIDETEIIELSKLYETTISEEKRLKNKKDWFGPGCIYNSPYSGQYYVADRNRDNAMDIQDAFSSTTGEINFYLYGSIPGEIGFFVGFNPLILDEALSDVAGGTPEDNGTSIKRRFRPDGQFAFDWFALAKTSIPVAPINLTVTDDKNNPLPFSAYQNTQLDLVSGTENRLKVRSDKARELFTTFRFSENSQELASGSWKEGVSFEAALTPSKTGPSAVILRTDMMLTPTKTISLPLMQFDVVGSVMITILKGSVVYTGIDNGVTLQLSGIASLNQQKIQLQGAGVNATEEVNSEGIAYFTIKPTMPGEVLISLLSEDKLLNPPRILVLDSSLPPLLELDAYPDKTKSKELVLTGRTNPGCQVTLDSIAVNVDNQTGKFSLTLQLPSEVNTFQIQATNPLGRTNKKEITITRVLKGPELIIDPIPDPVVDTDHYTITGSVKDPLVKVFINLELVELNGLNFSYTVPLKMGKNEFIVQAIDEFDLVTEAKVTITLAKKLVILLTIGKNAMYVNGKAFTLDAPPFILNNRTMVPIRAIAEAFGAKVNWQAKSETVEIELDGIFISMQIGNTMAMVGQKIYVLDAPPIIRKSRTFVPIRFISEALLSEVKWDAATQTVIIERWITK